MIRQTSQQVLASAIAERLSTGILTMVQMEQGVGEIVQELYLTKGLKSDAAFGHAV